MKDPKFAVGFKNCVGCVDGTHIRIQVPIKEQGKFRSYKANQTTMNVMIGCDFSLTITYIYTGMEGTAQDQMVLNFAMSDGWTVPPGEFVIMDAGYGLTLERMTPIRGCRYHLTEWEQGKRRPKNPNELYNLRHAKYRSAIERVNALLKGRWAILKTPLLVIFSLCNYIDQCH